MSENNESKQEWAERVGREAVEHGFPAKEAMLVGGIGSSFRFSEDIPKSEGWGECWPDFRDRLTELACIPWLEDVARSEKGITAVMVSFGCGTCSIVVGPLSSRIARPALVEAAIAHVRAMRGIQP